MKKIRKSTQQGAKQQLIIVSVVLLLAIVSLASAFVFLYKPNSDQGEDLPADGQKIFSA